MPAQVRHILCPVDFSEGSRRALDHAVTLARRHQARLSVVHVQQLSMPMYGASYVGPEGLLQPIVLTDLERQGLLNRLDAEVAEDRMAAHVPIETVLDEAANISEAIVSRAHTTSVDLIVIGTHGRSGFERLMLGSVAEKVLRKAGCPVLTVPPHAPDSVPREAGALRRVLCPVDFSESSKGALDYAAALAREASARLTVLHVVEPIPALPEYAGAVDMAKLRHECFEHARTQLSRTVKEFVRDTCATDELVLVGRSHAEILRVAADQAADLIVLGVRGRGAADLMFFGSTTNHVVRGAHCPVLTVKDESIPSTPAR
ncbi:MAG: universal stress protein [Acidobacteria bacterium]|nr:universal stress protein [Acidobacteriota bacterium]